MLGHSAHSVDLCYTHFTDILGIVHSGGADRFECQIAFKLLTLRSANGVKVNKFSDFSMRVDNRKQKFRYLFPA